MNWPLFILAMLIILLGIYLWIKDPETWRKCPKCGRDLDPMNFHGWHEGSRKFCHWCSWDEDNEHPRKDNLL